MCKEFIQIFVFFIAFSTIRLQNSSEITISSELTNIPSNETTTQLTTNLTTTSGPGFLSKLLSRTSGKFCNKKFENNLFDSIFDFNQTVYVFRKPDSIWILKFDFNSKVWNQIGSELKLNDLFKSSKKMSSFDSGFSISDFHKCDPTKGNCDNNNRNIDSTNITFLFDDKNYLLFRRINENQFSEVDPTDKMVPWAANTGNHSKSIKDIFEDIDDRVDGAVFSPGAERKPEYVSIYSLKRVIEYRIQDNKSRSLKNIQLTYSPASIIRGKGGILFLTSQLFFVNNTIYEFMRNGVPNPWSQTYWQFFCNPLTDLVNSNSTSGSGNLRNIFSRTSNDFCDNKYENNLIDSVFDFNQTVYVFRKPESIWILKFDTKSIAWNQIGTEFKLNQLFNSSNKLKGFDAGFGVSDYLKCNKSQSICDKTNRNIDSTNITFLFDDKKYLLFRRIDENQFSEVDPTDKMVPWNANTGNHLIKNIFEDIDDRVDGSVYSPGADRKPEYVSIYSLKRVIEYPIQDNKSRSMKNKELSYSPAVLIRGKGGILFINSHLFFINNTIYEFMGNGVPKPWNLNFWQFFCVRDSITSSLMAGSDENQSVSSGSGDSGKPLQRTSKLFCDNQFENHLIDSIFDFNQTVYVFRKPNSIWILNFDSVSNAWNQFGSELKLKQLFQSSNNFSSFDSGFGIDSTNITFLFDNKKYILFRRINENQFSEVDPTDKMVPWAANTPNHLIKEIFEDIDDRVDGAVFSPGAGTKPQYVSIYSLKKIIEYPIQDNKSHSLKNTELTYSVALKVRGNGGIRYNNSLLFFINNTISEYTGSSILQNLNQTIWQFFCHRPTSRVIESNASQSDIISVKHKNQLINSSNASEIGSNATQIDSNVTEIDSNAKKIDSNATEIDSNAKKIDSNATEIDSNAKKIDSNATEIDSNATEIDLNATESDSNPTGIDSNATESDSNPTGIDSNATESDSNPTDINSNETTHSVDSDSTLVSDETTSSETTSVSVISSETVFSSDTEMTESQTTENPNSGWVVLKKDQKLHDLVLNLELVLFASVVVTAIIVTTTAIFGYITLSADFA